MLNYFVEIFLLIGVVLAKLLPVTEQLFGLLAIISIVLGSFLVRMRHGPVAELFPYHRGLQNKCSPNFVSNLHNALLLLCIGFITSASIEYVRKSNEKSLVTGIYCGYIVSASKYSAKVRVYQNDNGIIVGTYKSQEVAGNHVSRLYTGVGFSVNASGKGVFIESRECGSLFGIYYQILRFGEDTKISMRKSWEKVVGEESSILLMSILLGNRQMPEEIRSAVKSVGLLHVVAISGINISYLQFLAGAFTVKFSKNWRLIVDISLLIFLYVFVGEAVSLFRAIITFIVARVIEISGVKRSGLGVYVITFCIVLLFHVGDGFSASVLLTAAACLGAMVIGPWLVNLLKVRRVVMKELLISLIVWTCVSPVQYLLFREISVMGLFLGILTSGLVELISLFGYIVVIVSLVSVELGNLLVVGPGVLTAILLFIVRVFHDLLGGG